MNTKNNLYFKTKGIILSFLILATILTSCFHRKAEQKEEQISARSVDVSNETDSLLNSIPGNVFIATKPNSVILTGLADHKLITVYKDRGSDKKNNEVSNSSYSYDYDEDENEGVHFMPGIDILYGYNLVNMAHYNIKTEKLNFLFKHPVLIKTLYYPSSIQDSVNMKPINRNYYLISVFDEDTNKDSLINKRDLRRFYHFDSSSSQKTQLIPSDYSVERSQYDSQKDLMYIFARHDDNKNGTGDITEPIKIFWIDLKAPIQAKRLY